MGEAAQEIVPTICADNPHWPTEIVPFRLRETAFLHALGLTAAPDRVTFRLMDETGVQEDAYDRRRRRISHRAARAQLPVPGQLGIAAG